MHWLYSIADRWLAYELPGRAAVTHDTEHDRYRDGRR